MKQNINLNGKAILVTGAAGFIGAALVQRLLRECSGTRVVGLDSLNSYYDPALKEARLRENGRAQESGTCSWRFVRGNVADKALVSRVFEEERPDLVVHLAAQAGVRYSHENPDAFIESNVVGFFNILEACRHSLDGGSPGVRHLVYASSSSVYGGNKKVPFSTDDPTDQPVSLYAATKKSNELMAHCYAKLYNFPCTGLRFFTVYGPWGRPDMFYYSAARKMASREEILLFNYGRCRRDFTYVGDIVEGVVRVMAGAPEQKTGEDGLPVPPCALYNIGGGQPVDLPVFLRTLREELVRAGALPESYSLDAFLKPVPMQPGDVPVTYADCAALERDYGFTPRTGIREGLRAFAEWYKAWER